MSIRAHIAFRTPGEIEAQHLETMSRVLYRQFGREAFHSSEEYIELLTPLTHPVVVSGMERNLGVEFADTDHLYEIYTTRNFWSLDYMRGAFGSQLDWMSALKIAFPTIEVFYYSGDAANTPWKSILPSEIGERRDSYLFHAINEGIGYDSNVRAAR